MMITSSLRLVFVLVYKSTYLWIEPEKRKHLREGFVVFNEMLILSWFNCHFFAKKFSCD